MKIIKKIILVLVLSVFMFSVACTDENQTQGTVNQAICIGDAIQLTCVNECEWISGDMSIATVTQEGIVKGVGEGTVKIYAKTADITYEATIKVYDDSNVPEIIVEGKQTVKVGEEITLKSSVINSDETFVYTYSSNDNAVLTVTSEGKVTGVSTGIATITITATASSEFKKEILFYIYEVSDDGKIINNYIDNKVYEITGEIDLTKLNERITGIVESNKESIVGVSNYQYAIYQSKKELLEAGVGTGFIFKKDEKGTTDQYYVLTNYHVIEDNEKVKVYFGYEDKYVDASVYAQNEELDLAVLVFNSSNEYKLIELGDVNSVAVGDFAIAIGNANGYEFYGSVTFGVISYIDRVLTGEVNKYLQHDVAINPGNSGGPLFDINGKVIGINTLKIVESDVDNMGFAISINDVIAYLKTLDLM